jgi:type IV pilus assembly protein PilM
MATSNPLANIAQSLQGILSNFKKGADTVVGVDVGSSSIKIVQLKKEYGKVVLQTYGEVATGPYDNKKAGELPNLPSDKLVSAIQDVLKESNVNTKNGAFSLQASASLLFVLDLPRLSDQEIEKIIPHEARKYIPVPINEVSLDWWLIPHQEYTENEEEAQKSQALVVAVRKETITQYNNLVKDVGLSSGLLEVEVFSAIRSTFHHELQPVVLVDFGAASTRVAVVEYGVVKTFHTINRGSHYISQSLATSLSIPFEEAEKMKKEIGMGGTGNEDAIKVINTAVNYIFSEINSVLLEYEKEYHRSIGKMILVGGGSRLNGFHERASREFQFDVLYGDPFGKAQSPEFLENVLEQSGPEFAVALGLALKQLQ